MNRLVRTESSTMARVGSLPEISLKCELLLASLRDRNPASARMRKPFTAHGAINVPVLKRVRWGALTQLCVIYETKRAGVRVFTLGCVELYARQLGNSGFVSTLKTRLVKTSSSRDIRVEFHQILRNNVCTDRRELIAFQHASHRQDLSMDE